MFRIPSYLLVCLIVSPTSFASTLAHSEAAKHQLTLYQQGIALVESTFSELPSSDHLKITGLPSALMPDTLLLTGIDAERYLWDAARIHPNRLLQAVLGQTLRFEHQETLEQFEAQLISVSGGQMQILRDGFIKNLPVNGVWQPLLPAPESLHATELSLESVNQEGEPFSVAYLTQNVNWSAHYSIELNATDRIDLSARAALSNNTEVAFMNAEVDLLAGKPKTPGPQAAPRLMEMAMAVADSAPASNQEAIQGYHLFSLDMPLSLAPNQTQHVPLLPKRSIEARLSYRYAQPVYSGLRAEPEKGQAGQWLEFIVPEGIADSPLPEGDAQLYRRDSSGILRFVGSERLIGTSPGQRVELNFGDAFDLRIERRQTDYQRTGNTFEQSYEVRFENGSEESRALEYTVNYAQPWTLIDSSQLPTADGMQSRWLVDIPARGQLTLNYTVRLNRP